jgi:processive 1,2-diacylglycerol beta-glucosyltransferase
VGRRLLLLDVMPGHGRDNLLHELEQGGAHVCVPTARGLTASALALRDETVGTAARSGPPGRWEPAYVAALRRVGLDLQPPVPVPAGPADLITSPPSLGPAALPLCVV